MRMANINIVMYDSMMGKPFAERKSAPGLRTK